MEEFHHLPVMMIPYREFGLTGLPSEMQNLNEGMSLVRFRWIPLFGMLFVLFGCEEYQPKPLDPGVVEHDLAIPAPDALRIQAKQFHHPTLQPVDLDLTKGLTADQTAILAVLVNPQLKAARDHRGVAAAQLLVAGILPNPQISANLDAPFGANAGGTYVGYGLGLSWDVTSVLGRDDRIHAAEAQADSVALDIAWQEWQVAEAAKLALYDLVALQQQLSQGQALEQEAREHLAALQNAVVNNRRTRLDLADAQSTVDDAHAVVLDLEHQVAHQRLLLNQAIGVPPTTVLTIRQDINLPSSAGLPAEPDLLKGLEERRLDLLALKRGYDSEDSTLRAAIAAQFPHINLGFNGASDTSNLQTFGLGVSIDLPIFDHGQGGIATERATRQQLFDEYTQRVSEARYEVALASEDLRALTGQIQAANASIASLQTLITADQQAVDIGRLDVLSLHTAQAGLLQKRLDLFKLQQQEMENWVALEIAAGEYLSGRRADANTTPPKSEESAR